MLISKSEIEAVKARHELVGHVRSCGVPLKPVGKYFVGPCPFHVPDKTPSFLVDPVRQLFNCLGACRNNGNGGGGKGRSGGDLFSFEMRRTGKSFREVFASLDGEVKDELPPPRVRKAPPLPFGAGPAFAPAGLSSRAPRTELFSRVAERLHRELAQSREAQQYLESRGLVTRALWKAFKLGFSNGSLEELAGEETPTRKLLVEMGLLTEHGRERMKGRVVFPLTALNQLPVGLYGRAISDAQEPHHLFLSGPRRGLFNWNAARRSKQVLIVEAVIDALSLIEAGVGNVVPIYGVNGVTPDHAEMVRRFEVESIVLGLDADEAGREKTGEVVAAFEALSVRVRVIEWPEKDPNEVLVRHGAKRTREIVERLLAAPAVSEAVKPPPLIAAVPLLEETEPDAVREEAGAEPGGVGSEAAAPPAPAPLVVAPPSAEVSGALSADELHHDSGPRGYEVRGVKEAGRSATALRVRIRLVSGESRVIDAVDLYSARSRGVFLSHAVEAGLGERGEIERDLVAMTERIESILAEREKASASAPSASAAKPPELSPAEREEALASFLNRADLFDMVDQDMTALGYVGEGTNKRIGYLVAVSRKLPEPLSLILMSQSGSGKSALADVLEQMTPPEDVFLFSRLTPQALFYMERDALVRKFIIIEERAGSFEADYSIRTLQSKKKLVLAIPIKDPATGRMKTEVFEILGPAAFLEGTTESHINIENASRCFEGYCDESEEQTKRIHEWQKRSKSAEGRELLSARPGILRRHHNAQRLLETVRVEIPYWRRLTFPTSWLRTRRDHWRFLNLIEAIAFLHQFQREKKTDGEGSVFIEANVADYRKAYELAADLLTQTLSDAKRPALSFYESVRGLSENRASQTRKRPEEVFLTRREIREATGLPDHRVIVLLSELVQLEYLEVLAGSQGRMFRYRLLTPAPKSTEKLIAGLLTPEELEELLARSGKGA